MTLLLGHGHPAVRASHAKTLEFTPSAELGAGGTCVVAVGASVEGVPLAGAVRLELTAGAASFSFEALANPDWDATGPAVVRRSDVRRPDTLATHATASAADLPRELVAALRDRQTPISLRMTRLQPQPARLVIVAGPVPAAEQEAAGGARLLVTYPAPPELLAEARPAEVLGLPPQQAVAAASPQAFTADMAALADVAALADQARRNEALVLRVAVPELERVLRTATRHGRRTGALLTRSPWVQWGPLASLSASPGARTGWLSLDPVPPGDLDERIAALRSAGMSTRDLARALSAELGLPAKDVYARALQH
ncbi:DUF371 domain-containing protein [Jatrophihabitans sp.]|uniref:DUF371 domain-containing protein n=1 Tax=Jatrophihabitans sp. TaxID=1932789 RepID=UPI0030C69001|nr:hypothetical protein [Jatrophihabitans sp.]